MTFPAFRSSIRTRHRLKPIQQAAKSLDYPDSRRKEVAAVLRETNASLGSGEATTKNIDRLANGAVAVLSGQQVGLFGGPAYAFYKALSAIQIAHELTQSGVDAVPIFWMATEDHDLDEVRHVSWFHAGKRTRFELPAEEQPGSSRRASEAWSRGRRDRQIRR